MEIFALGKTIQTILEAGDSAVLLGLLFVLAVPTLRKKFGFNGNGNYQPQIDELKEHSRVANQEMGEIREHISDIKADISYIKGKLDQ